MAKNQRKRPTGKTGRRRVMGNGRVTAPKAAPKLRPEHPVLGTVDGRDVRYEDGTTGRSKSTIAGLTPVKKSSRLRPDGVVRPVDGNPYPRLLDQRELTRTQVDKREAALQNSHDYYSQHVDDPEKAAEIDAWKRSLAFRKQLRSDEGKHKLQRFIDIAQLDGRTGMGVPPGVIENSPRWLRDAMNGEIFILDDHMADVAAKRAVASKWATINPFEPFAPAGVVWFPNLMAKIVPFIERAVEGVADIEGPNNPITQAAADTMQDTIENHLGWLAHEHPYLSGEALAGIAWKVEGDKVTIFWLNYDFYPAFSNAKNWLEGDPFNTPTQDGPYSHNVANGIFAIDPLYDMSLYHYWTCISDSTNHAGCLRPDQPDAPFVTPFEATVWENEKQTSTLKRGLWVDEEMCQEMDDQMWFMISFACELLRLMSEEVTRHVPVNRHTGGRNLERDIKKNLPQRGIRTFVLRRFGSSDDEDSGIKRPRGPLTTRHSRKGSWHVSQTQKGDLDCRHRWKGSSARSTWRICQHCHRREIWHSSATVGPDGAPWAYAVKIGLVVR